MKQNSKTVVGIIGGAGTGKTYIGTYIAGALDGLFIEADKVGHEVLTLEDTIVMLVKEFGSAIIVNGAVDRKTLGSIVFNDKEALSALNQIVHPIMFKRIKQMISNSETRFVILEAAVMIEANFNQFVDHMVLLEASEPIKVERLVHNRHIDKDNAISLINLNRIDLSHYADDTFDTSNNLETIKESLDIMITAIKEAN